MSPLKRNLSMFFPLISLCLLTFLPLKVNGATDWKNEANQRIERIRKRDLEIKLVNPQNIPLRNYQIQIKQLRHHFAFGTAVNNNLRSNHQYADFIKNHFEWAVCENEAKWYHNQPTNNQVTYADADYIYNFCKQNNITMRGHCIFWAVEQFVQEWVKQLSNGELSQAIDSRLDGIVNHFKGKYVHWDVCNEMLHGNFFPGRLGTNIYSHMFKKTKEIDPQVKCFVNDYSTFEWSPGETTLYINQIKNLLNEGAPIDGIGCQGHFNQTIDPELTYNKLNEIAQLKIPIWITEYDSVNSDQYKRADNLEILYRTAFSHPSVEGVLMWGFWAGSHWRGADAAIVNLDWTLNEAGRRYEALLNEWTTNQTENTNNAGSSNFRGFHGTYEVIITAPNGHIFKKELSLLPDESPLKLTYQLDASNPNPSPSILPSPLISPEPSPHNDLKLKMYNGNRTPNSSIIDPHFRLNNLEDRYLNLSDLKIRYYYTNEPEKMQNFWSDQAMVITLHGEYRSINSNIQGKFVQLNSSKTGANCYLEIGFHENAGELKPGDLLEIQLRIANSDWTNYNQADDYSFNSTENSFVDWKKATVYEKGKLIWGIEP